MADIKNKEPFKNAMLFGMAAVTCILFSILYLLDFFTAPFMIQEMEEEEDEVLEKHAENVTGESSGATKKKSDRKVYGGKKSTAAGGNNSLSVGKSDDEGAPPKISPSGASNAEIIEARAQRVVARYVGDAKPGEDGAGQLLNAGGLKPKTYFVHKHFFVIGGDNGPNKIATMIARGACALCFLMGMAYMVVSVEVDPSRPLLISMSFFAVLQVIVRRKFAVKAIDRDEMSVSTRGCGSHS